MSSSVEKIKERLSITDVVGSYIKLIKAGNNLKAPCPFHHEKNPSFIVSPSRESFYCFGCNKGGDIFSFVQEIEGLSFLDTLKILADRSGVELKNEDKKLKSESQILSNILEEATNYYSDNLKVGSDYEKYLKKRGISKKIMDGFRIGYATNDWQNLTNYLTGKKYNIKDIKNAGLSIIRDDGRVYDRFRNRIMFPIENNNGKVIGFSGRIFGKDSDITAKYINTPQTLLYDKSKSLYGYSKAKNHIRKNNACIVVEGQMDLISSHEAGVMNVVAVSGTALSKDHLLTIKRMTNNIIFSFDHDEAGLLASKRAVSLALSLSMNVLLAELPDGYDPSDLILDNKALWKEKTQTALHIVDYYYNDICKKFSEKKDIIIAITKELLPLIYVIENNVEKAHFISKIASDLSVKEDSLWDELKKVQIKSNYEEKDKINTGNDKFITSGKPREDKIIEKILAICMWSKENKQDKNVENNLKKLENLLGKETYEAKKSISKHDKDRLIYEQDMYYKNSINLDEILLDLFINLEEEIVKRELSKTIDLLKKYETKKDQKNLEIYMKKCQNLSQKLNNLKINKNQL